MKKKNKIEFNNLIDDIINNNEFKKIDNEIHHGISRMMHAKRVSKMTYNITKKLNMNYQSATRAALLHDFYLNSDLNCNSFKALKKHPNIACDNASKHFNITSLESNIIKSHMFPLGEEKPKYSESFIVSFSDKIVALYEMLKYKLSLKLSIYIFFAFNLLTIKK